MPNSSFIVAMVPDRTSQIALLEAKITKKRRLIDLYGANQALLEAEISMLNGELEGLIYPYAMTSRKKKAGFAFH